MDIQQLQAQLPLSDGAEIAALVALARAFEAKLQRLHEDLDPAWQAELAQRWAGLAALAEPARAALRPALFIDLCGGLPALPRLMDPLARLVLLPREDLVGRLCALALARRPGVLRCCVDRQALDAMRRALGTHFDPLMALSQHGRPLGDAATRWSPAHWACMGYFDWVSRLAPNDGVLRRVARLSLPPGLLGRMARLQPVPADLRTTHALRSLAEAGVEWPC